MGPNLREPSNHWTTRLLKFVYCASVRVESKCADTQDWTKPTEWSRTVPVPVWWGKWQDPACRTRPWLHRARTVHVIVVSNNKTSCWQKQQRKNHPMHPLCFGRSYKKHCFVPLFSSKRALSKWFVFVNHWGKKKRKECLPYSYLKEFCRKYKIYLWYTHVPVQDISIIAHWSTFPVMSIKENFCLWLYPSHCCRFSGKGWLNLTPINTCSSLQFWFNHQHFSSIA